MRLSILFAFILFTLPSYSIVPTDKAAVNIEKKMSKVFKVFESSNNIKVILVRLRKHMSPQLFFALTKQFEKITNPHVVVRKKGRNKLQLKVTPNKWVTFEFDYKTGKTKFENHPFQINRKFSPDQNFAALKKIIEKELRPKKVTSLENLVIQNAEAWVHVPIMLIAAALGIGGTVYYVHDEVTFTSVVHAGLRACKHKRWDVADPAFKELRKHVDTLLIDYFAIDQYHKLQNCMLTEGRINYKDAYDPKIEESDIPFGAAGN